MMSLAFVTAGGFVLNRRRKARADKMMTRTYAILVYAALLVLLDMLVSGPELSLDMVTLDLMPYAASLWILSSSLLDTNVMKWGLRLQLFSGLCTSCFHFGRIFIGLELPSSRVVVYIVSLISVIMILLFICALAERMKNVKSLMKNGTVWATVSLSVDIVYFFFFIIAAALLQEGFVALATLILAGQLSAVGARILSDSKFLIWQRQESLIIESMKVTSVTSASDPSHIDDVYKELYERIVAYFELKKPYLDSDLTINDIVKDIYSNKLYISKAISQFTGRNFCQFVNYYRIIHSMECFRKNPELKIHELATMNGFNSVVSYSMAFRLFMGETPSEWYRKEKSRLLKKGK